MYTEADLLKLRVSAKRFCYRNLRVDFEENDCPLCNQFVLLTLEHFIFNCKSTVAYRIKYNLLQLSRRRYLETPQSIELF
ncbi:unnamed protein product [Allacma fusca]|uniref:Uncharacterized protein n=1 Tax=Allacma fusca TaxID=39272 RepID=A0A8J2PWT4_9HEXA|nr:unnamed protein product [Allacma fusca]